jgi:GntR family transcriptional regulator
VIKPLHINIDAKSALPIYEQVKFAIKLAVFSGYLAEGDQLTSIRDLSLQLKINPNTILKVYSQLETEGFISPRQGSGHYVKVDPARVRKEKYSIFEELCDEYVLKATGLGYTVDELLKVIQRKYQTCGQRDDKEPPNASS